MLWGGIIISDGYVRQKSTNETMSTCVMDA